MTLQEPASLRDYFLLGVYNSTYEADFNGGPHCSKESTIGFKLGVTISLLPYHLLFIYWAAKFLGNHNERVK